MKKLIMTKGLPASGKTTWAKAMVAKNPNVYKRVNKDDLRAMIDAGVWSKDNERFILAIRDHIIATALAEGKHVIVDDTNFAPKHEQQFREFAKEHNAEFEVRTFNISIEDCIARDLARTNSVGEAVIRKMHNQYIASYEQIILKQDDSLPRAIIVDIDGTLAKMNGRGPYEWDKVETDLPNIPVINAVRVLENVYHIIFLSGRDGSCKVFTEKWIFEHLAITFDRSDRYKLFMRSAGDMRKDAIVKKELFDTHIRDKYYIEFVLDDRNQVVDLWRKEIGLPCFQVDYGDF